MFSRTLPRTPRRLAAVACLSLAALVAAPAPVAACSWDYLIWEPRGRSADPLYRFIRGGKAGYIDRSGRVRIEPKFKRGGNYGGVFRDGLMEVGASSGEYVDATGKTAIMDGPYRGWDFSEGLAAATAEGGGKWGYIDRTGKFVISPRFENHPRGYVNSFAEGHARIQVSGKYGFIDRSGEFVIPPRYKYAEDFSEGLAAVGVLHSEDPAGVYYIDRGGRVRIRGPFHVAGRFFKGLAHVELKPLIREKDGESRRTRRFAYINAEGKTVFAYDYEEED